ncbi:DgyrCDS5764 [Dimorphilus gyrociliatus]|uniref:DgyrCDS5764 n=1 Tax=Dimorphilus gyrociliatus TaxID=2664684 RepID=A0A7I8VQQ1_9ANNE|nr:DgyrCDS5764 [Dimorphilus gyrociliatus]
MSNSVESDYSNHRRTSSITSNLSAISSKTTIESLESEDFNDKTNKLAHLIANLFWKPSLSFTEFVYDENQVDEEGYEIKKYVDFESLWPTKNKFSSLLKELSHEDNYHEILNEILIFSFFCNIRHVFQILLNDNFIGINHQLLDGFPALHTACIAQNIDAVCRLVTQMNDSEIKSLDNKYAFTAYQVARCQDIRRVLPNARYSLVQTANMIKMSNSSNYFEMARNPDQITDLQLRLQLFKFDVNRQYNEDGNYLIHIATETGTKSIPLLLSLVRIQKCDVDIVNGSGLTPLMLAAQRGHVAVCDVLICVLGANPNIINPENGWSALHYAAKYNRIEVIGTLEKRGGDFNTEDFKGRRPDDVASFYKNYESKWLLEHLRYRRTDLLKKAIDTGKLNKFEIRPTDLVTIDRSGYTLLMLSSIQNRYEILEMLLTFSNAPIDAQHSEDLKTALCLAASAGNTESCAVLLSEGANPTVKDMASLLPLHYAVQSDNLPCVQLLLSNSAGLTGLVKALEMASSPDVERAIKDSMLRRQSDIVAPALFDCAVKGDVQKLYTILEDGDEVNPMSAAGDWPLYLAAENGHLEVVKFLIEKGGSLYLKHSRTNSTVLHAASMGGHIDLLVYLMQFTTNNQNFRPLREKEQLGINDLTFDMKTALQLAADKGFGRIVRLLLRNGATTSVTDWNGKLYICPDYDGVQLMIEQHRRAHIKAIMEVLNDKKGIQRLKNIWLLKFDHNLKDINGNTMLMLACRLGRSDMVQYMLESAVYELDRRPNTPRLHNKKIGFLSSSSSSFNEMIASQDVENSLGTENAENPVLHDSITNFMEDLVKQKEHSLVYPDNRISHVSVQHSQTGKTSYHYALDKGDQYHIIKMLIEKDQHAANIQDSSGLSALHYSCLLNRKRSVEVLLSKKSTDVNLRTLEGQLPEELTKINKIRKMIEDARKASPERMKGSASYVGGIFSMPSTIHSVTTDSLSGSSVDFDRLNTQFVLMKQKMMKSSANTVIDYK